MPPLSKAVTSTPHAPKGPNSKKAVASPPPRGMNPAPHSVEVHRARPGSREVGTGSQSMWGGFQPARDARRASPRRKAPNSKAAAKPPPRGMNPAPHSVEVHRARPGSREVDTGNQSMWGGFQPARDARRASPRRRSDTGESTPLIRGVSVFGAAVSPPLPIRASPGWRTAATGERLPRFCRTTARRAP